MRRKPLMATVLVSAVAGALLALLAPAAAADSGSDSESSPGNRGWVTGSHTFGDDSDSGDSGD
ncbi:MAG TPA: hypothetical protein VD903_08440 [Pseudonocardia sp.]|nr:hypothetical protein [Pseudonocardia sp.]